MLISSSKPLNIFYPSLYAEMIMPTMLKFICSEKATQFYEIFPLLLTTVHTVKSWGKISQNFVAFSEYMNFKLEEDHNREWNKSDLQCFTYNNNLV